MTKFPSSLLLIFTLTLTALTPVVAKITSNDQQSNQLSPPVSQIKNNFFNYEGYRFDCSQILGLNKYTNENLDKILLQLEWQVCFVNTLRLPQKIKDFLESVPISIVPDIQGAESTNKQLSDYGDTRPKAITLRAEELLEIESYWEKDKWETPWLLYFLIMAYFDQQLPQGINNSDIIKYFEQAKSLPCYQEQKPLWISNDPSSISYFFIDSVISYLRGSFWEAPYSCYAIKKNQPEFFDYLEKLFGTKSGFLNQCFSYHGYSFNWPEMDNSSHYQEVCDECIRQVHYIELAGLPENITNFLKSVPLKLKPWYQMPDSASGVYWESSREIRLNHDEFYSHQKDGLKAPTLLHELLHAFHHQCITDSWDNPKITQFFQDAQQHHYYELPKTFYPEYISYLMTNKPEFFACTASVFLVDFECFEPFNRDNIFQHQPEYYHYLQTLFHSGYGMYNPAMESPAIDDVKSFFSCPYY